MLQKVKAFIDQQHMLEKGDRLIAGVSGGVDSVCLLLLLCELQPVYHVTVEAVHVHHGIRGKDADEDARFVEALCSRLEVPCRQYRYDVPSLASKEHCSLEEMGRKVRYMAFDDACGKAGASKIAVAHHIDDQAETMLFHLFRGTGLKGLAGIPPVRGAVIRPLLCVQRAEIEKYVTERGYTWREDQSNGEDFHIRNKIRHHVISYAREHISPAACANMARTAEHLTEVEQFMRQSAKEALELNSLELQADCAGRLAVSRQRFLGRPAVLQEYMIRECLLLVRQTLNNITAEHVRQVRTLLDKQSGKQIVLPGGLIVSREYDQLIFELNAAQGAEPFCFRVTVPGNIFIPHLGICLCFEEKKYKKNAKIPISAYTKWFDYDKIKNPLVVRSRKPGDVLAVSGEGGHKTVKRYFIDEKIPRAQREQIALLADEEEVVWVCGYRISERYKVTEQTERILEVTLKRPDSQKTKAKE